MADITVQPVIDASPAYDLLMCGHLLVQRPKRGKWSAWAEAQVQQMPLGEWQALRRWFGGDAKPGSAYMALIPLLPHPCDTAALLDGIARLPLPDFLRLALTASWIAPDAPLDETTVQTLVGDRATAETYLNHHLRLSGHERRFILTLLDAPDAARTELTTTLERLAERNFAPLEPQLVDEREQAAHSMTERLAQKDEFIAWLDRAKTDLTGFSPVVVAPAALLEARLSVYAHEVTHSLFTRPNYEPCIILVGPRWGQAPRRRATRAVKPQQESPEEWAAFHAALADPARLRLLRLLATRPHYGQELAKQLQMSAATVSHHLNVLTRAGLVSMERRAHRTYIVLHAERLREQLLASADFVLHAADALPPEE